MNTPMNSNLITRTITGVIFVAVLVGAILTGPIPFAVLFAVITALTTWEFCTILNQNLHLQINRFITTVAAVILFFSILGFYLGLTGIGMFVPFFISVLYLMVSELYLKNPNPLHNWAFSLMALFYIALPFSLLGLLSLQVRAVDGIGMPYSVIYHGMMPLSIFIFLWTNDSGAYLTGSMLGRHRLFPSISPKKSWEGSIGGGIVAILASQIIAMWATDYFSLTSPLLNRLGWAGLALVVVVFGTWGDLVESLLKRKLNIKDSGNILPGHGGMLDRFDSSLLAIPAATVYIYTLSVYFG